MSEEMITATDAPISYGECELIVRAILEDFTLPNAANIKKVLHDFDDKRANTIGLSVQDFIDYETKVNKFGKDAFTYLWHINRFIRKLCSETALNPVSSFNSGFPMLGDKYVSFLMPQTEDYWRKITTYASYLGLDYVRERVSPYSALFDVIDEAGDHHTGSGTLVAPNVILTCKHVVDQYKINGIFINNEPYDFVDAKLSVDKDIALVHISQCTLEPSNDIIFGVGSVLEQIMTFGYPPIPMLRETPLSVQRGEINAISKDYNGDEHLIYSSIVRPGNSGGAIISEKGLFVGMVTEHLERKTSDNTISVDSNLSVNDQIQSVCEQINSIPQLVPFYAGISAKEIFNEINKMMPELQFTTEF